MCTTLSHTATWKVQIILKQFMCARKVSLHLFKTNLTHKFGLQLCSWRRGSPTLRSFKELKVVMLNEKIEAAPQTIGQIVTKTTIVCWSVFHKIWCSGSSNCLGSNSLSGSISWWTFSHSPDDPPLPGGHRGNVRKRTWNLPYACISTIYLGLRQYFCFL